MSDSIVVLGAGGFVGRHLVTALAARGESVIALTRTPPDQPLPADKTVSGAFEDPDDFAPWLAGARAVVHAASCSTPGRTAGKPLEELQANLRPTLALLDALQAAPKCELLYLSSGGTLYGETYLNPAGEQDVIRPKSYYGAGKAAAEHFIHAYAMQYQRAVTLLRPANIYGPGQGLRGGFGIIPTAFEHIRTGTPLTLWGGGGSVRDYLYIDDFIRLCLAILRQPMDLVPRMFNAASGEGVRLSCLIDTIRQVTGAALPVTHDTSRAVDIERIVLDASLASREFDWAPQVSLHGGLERTWQWWSQQA